MRQLLLLLFVACHREPVKNEVRGVDIERGHAIATRLKQALSSEVTTAMAKGVPAAIDVCATRAPAIAAELSTGDVAVGRATRRPRNPSNQADGWKLDAIAHFEAVHTRGEPLASARFSRVLPRNRIAYAEPLVIAELCTTCHGSAIAPEIATAIAARYPGDQATGYAVGDLRGVVWVELDRERK
jgi:hypothetical protein